MNKFIIFTIYWAEKKELNTNYLPPATLVQAAIGAIKLWRNRAGARACAHAPLGLTTVHEEGDDLKKEYKTCDNSNCGSPKAII